MKPEPVVCGGGQERGLRAGIRHRHGYGPVPLSHNHYVLNQKHYSGLLQGWWREPERWAKEGRDPVAECRDPAKSGTWLLSSAIFSGRSIDAASHAFEALTLSPGGLFLGLAPVRRVRTGAGGGQDQARPDRGGTPSHRAEPRQEHRRRQVDEDLAAGDAGEQAAQHDQHAESASRR
ncbi:hypothetical protein ACI2LC_42615 [Nonomuraea wenchangensis]|uniref:hypothetical protein n=1 Tax=Nonomuraea wenchangensis TaxID=568860 RepID=UPI00384D265F